VSSFGGQTREYQVRLDPNKLIAYGLTLAQVEQALQNNNINAGGSFIQEGAQQINVRAVGLYTDVQDIENTLLKSVNGTPVFVRDVATVEEGAKIRLGQIGKTVHDPDGTLVDNKDTVEGVLLLQKGDDSDTTLVGIHQEVKDLNAHVLPKGVRVVPFLDRSDLLAFTTHTVLHNLTEGIVLVMVILFLFLGNVRGALIVSLTIPFALLFASICLSQLHIPANLLSLGALDFGMVVDGAVVMVENIVRRLSHDEGAAANPMQVIRLAAHEVQRPVFYPIGIIIVAYLPIFTLQAVEGRLFRPMAWTVAFALLGALIFAMFVAPVLSSFLFPRGTTEWENPLLVRLLRFYRRSLNWAIRRRGVTVTVAALALVTAIVLFTSGAIGSEFLPHLDEGSIWVRGTLAPSTGPDVSVALTNRARVVLASFPEVTEVVSQTGRPDDGTDTTGFYNTEYFVGLKPKDKWRPVFKQNKDELIAAMDRQLEKMPGVLWNFSQPISDNVEEAVSGVKGELVVKIYGDDLHTLENLGDRVVQVMGTVPGIADLGLFRVIGQPNLNYTVNREAAARYGINVSDVQDAIQTAVGAAPITQVLRGEARYDLTMRYQAKYRDTPDALNHILLTAQDGERVPLTQLTTVKTQDGAEEIYREGGERFVAVKYSVRGRALGSAVEDAINQVNKQVKVPQGYHMSWAGEFQSEKRADKRLSLVVPLALFVIFLILYLMFGSFKWALLILANVAMAPFGGMLALLITGTNFSVSSGVGFLALFGVSVQTGIIMLEYINQLRGMGMSVAEAAVEGAVQRLRPIMMTMVVATLGLLPAATSHGIGSDSQRPFAIVIVGGLIGALLLSVYLLPTLYVWVARPGDRLPSAHVEGEV
jgi:cobalt-zinc-cadmium resistance protein CzcA